MWPPGKIVDWKFGLSVEVNDSNWIEKFEEFKDTPVMFFIFAPWCGFSKRASYEWATVSNAVNAPDSKYHYIAAHFNVNHNPEVKEILRVKESHSINPYPQYKVMRDGRLYAYPTRGAKESSVASFGETGWESVPFQYIEWTLMDHLLHFVETAQFLMLNHTRGAVMLVLVGVFGGLPCGLLLGYMLFGCASSRVKKPVSNGKKEK